MVILFLVYTLTLGLCNFAFEGSLVYDLVWDLLLVVRLRLLSGQRHLHLRPRGELCGANVLQQDVPGISIAKVLPGSARSSCFEF